MIVFIRKIFILMGMMTLISLGFHNSALINRFRRGNFWISSNTITTPEIANTITTTPTLAPTTTHTPVPTKSPHISDGEMCDCSWKSWKREGEIANEYKVTIPWSNSTVVDYLGRRHPNWPSGFLTSKINELKVCHLLPDEFMIHWQNTYWQEVTLSGESKIHLYSAFYDPRNGTDLAPCIRLLGVTQSMKLPNLWCHLWFNTTSKPVVSKVVSQDHIDYQEKASDRQMPYLFTCDVPKNFKGIFPRDVSIVKKPCSSAKNLLRVIGDKQRIASAYTSKRKPDDARKDTKGHAPAVCGPALFYYHEDFSARLVEWLEMLKALKFSKVYLLQTDVHPNIEKVLQYYEERGFVEVTMYSYPSPYINEPNTRKLWSLIERRKMFAQENIYFTDCLLRHMHQHRFIAHFDPDELPVLLRHKTFTEFLDERLEKEHPKLPVVHQLEWRFFNSDIPISKAAKDLPEYLWMLRHIKRPIKRDKIVPVNFKSLYDMNVVRGVFSHNALYCVKGKCKHNWNIIPTREAYLGHFSKECGNKCKSQSSTIEEPILHKHKKEVAKAVRQTLKKLEIIY